MVVVSLVSLQILDPAQETETVSVLCFVFLSGAI